MNLYNAKKIGVTDRNCAYIILQDGPHSFHISVQRGHHGIGEHFRSITNQTELDTALHQLESELLDRLEQHNANTKESVL